MPEIDRVNNAIDAHFEIIGGDQSKKVGDIKMLHVEKLLKLSEPIERCIYLAEVRVGGQLQHKYRFGSEISAEDEALRQRIEAAKASVEKLKAEIAKGNGSPDRFKTVIEEVMVARRAGYPLTNPDVPWETPTPEEALHNDNDPHSFSIFDSLVEPIQDLLPPLHQLACEDWEDEDDA